MKRTAILYLATVLVMVPLDILFLGVIARGFFQSQVGDMLGGLRLLPAIVFYLMYAAGILVFVSGSDGATLCTGERRGMMPVVPRAGSATAPHRDGASALRRVQTSRAPPVWPWR